MKIFGFEVRRHYPTKVTIDINTQCNARCIICPYPEIKSNLRHGIMDWDLYCKIIDNYSTICYSNKIQGELSYCNMSEPTLLPELPEYIRYTRDKGCFTIYFNTNGSMLTPKLIDAFVRDKTFPAIHFNIMAFSKEKYEKVMGLDFDILRENLNYILKKYPHCLIDVGFFMPLIDHEEVKAIKAFFMDAKVTLHLSRDITDRAGNVLLPDGLNGFRSKTKKRSFGCSKNRPIHRMHINYDGRVYLCDQDMGLETNFGSVREKTIEEVWNGEVMMYALKIIYGFIKPEKDYNLPCFKCEACIDDNRESIFRNPKDYKPRKLFGYLKRYFVKKGWFVVKKRGKLALKY